MRRWSINRRSARLRSSEVGLSSTVLGCRANCQRRSEFVIRSVLTPALTVATILSTTCCAEQIEGETSKSAKTINHRLRRLHRCINPPLERLRDAEMQISTMQTKYRWRAVEKNSAWTTLRNQKLRRIH